jgi:hypothetical protein
MRYHQHELPGTYRTFAWGRAPSTVPQRPRVPPRLGPMAPGGVVPTWQHRRVGQQTHGPPGQTGKRDSALARTIGATGGGDADPDPTLACSRAAHRGGLDSPLRRLTTIPDGPSWRRDLFAGPTTTEDLISRRSVVVSGLYPAKCGSGPVVSRSGGFAGSSS